MKIAYNPTTAAALTAAPSNNDITFDLKGVAIYAKGVKFKGTDTTYSVFKKHTASGNTGGYNGLVPVPSYTTTTVRFLREDGTWVTPTNTTYGIVSSTANGLAPKIGTEAAATITTQADEWILTSTKGGTPTWRKLPTNAFKNDNSNTTYTLSGVLSGNTYITTLTPSSGTATTATIPAMSAATSSAAGKAGLVPAPAANKHTSFLRGDGTWVIPTNTTYSIVTASANGLVPMFDAADGTIDSQSTDWVLTNNNGSIGWYKLPANAFKNDNSNTTYTLSGVLGSNKYTVTLTPSSGNATTATIPVMTGATSSAAGKAGLVPSPGTANAGQFLKGDGTWATPSDTHWTTHLYIGAKDAASNAVTTNGNTYIKVTDNSTIRNQYIIKGAGRATVASDASGNITITSPTVTWSEISGKPGTFTPSAHNHPTNQINALTSYTKATAAAALATTDSLNTALGKLEYKLDVAYDLVTKANDKDGTIENLKEILDVLAGIKDTETIKAIVGKYLPLAGGTMTLGEGLKFHADENYFGANLDARIISLLDGNGTTCDGGLIIDERCTSNGTTTITELLRIRDAEFKWRGLNILHAGNSNIKNGVITINGISITPLTSHQSLANYVTLNTALTISGVKTFSTLLKFTVAQGTAPFTVTSNTKVSNLNSDLLDGYDSSRFLRAKDWVTNPGLDANTLELNMMCFTYSNNAPHTGTIIYFSGATGGSYGLLLNASYSSSGYLSFRSRNGDSGTWKDWSTILTLHNYTNYVNTTNFPGLNKTGTVTSVAISNGGGLSVSGSPITTSGTITITNTGVRSTTINGNYLRVNTNGTNADLTIPYATTASLLNNTSVSDPSTAASGLNVKWYSQINQSSGYAGTNYGFPVSNNANGILWLGTHSGPYGWQMGFSSNGRIYARYISNNSFSTTANGGSWNRIAWTSDVPSVTNYYWANVKVSSSSSTTTTPTFAKWTTSDLNLVSYTTGGRDLGMRVTGSVNSIGFIVGSSNTNRGIYDYTNSVWILLKDASNNTLLPSGNVGIGITSPSQKLHVGGLVNITANSGTLTIGCQNTSYTHYSTTGGTHWFNKAVEVNGNLSPHANNSFTLGMSSKRWSNIYSVLGNFSGAVTIGGKTTTVGLENNSHYSWKGGNNFYCIPTGNSQEWSFDVGAKAYGDGTDSTYTGTYLLIWSCKNSNAIALFFNDTRHVNIPIHLYVGGYNNTSYALSTASFICQSWVRTTGSTGWYNETYGGGWYMTDGDYVRSYNNKRVYNANTSLYAFYAAGGMTAAGFYKAGSSDSYVLLGGGGHKALSDFMLKSEILTNNLTTISKSLTVTQAWMDTGIKYTDLPANGTYIVQLTVSGAGNSTGNMYSCYWSGIMSWYREGTNDSDADEIILHRSGHAYGNTLYLRTIMTANSDGRHLRLLIAANKDLGAAYTYTFKFKRII